MKRDFLTLRYRAMNNLERVAYGLFAGNILNATDREKLPSPCGNRIRQAWDGNPRERERWMSTAELILANLKGIDLGSMTGSREPVTLTCPRRYCRTAPQRALDAVTTAIQIGLAGAGGAYLGFYLANL
jgi:hypothetical protein